MKKTLTVNLNQSVFHIDEDAYQILKDYLASLEKHFQKETDSQEIISDIESRIAEKFSDKITKSVSVITLKDVNTVISQIGTLKDLAPQEDLSSSTNSSFVNDISRFFNSFKNKKIYRNTDNKVLGGVISGLSSYFSLDVTLLRLIIVLLFFIPDTSGFIFLAYMAFWLIVPEAKSAVDKLEMKGESLTISSLQSQVKSPSIKSTENSLQKILFFPFRVIAQVFEFTLSIIKKIFPIISSFIGFIIVICIALTIAGLTFSFIQLLFNDTTPYFGFSLRDTIPSPQLYFIFGSAFFFILLPLIFVLEIGSSFLSRRSTFTLSSTLGLFFLWIISLIILAASSFNVLPEKQAEIRSLVENNFQAYSQEKEYDFTDFDQIQLTSPAKLYVSIGDEYQIKAFANSKELDRLEFSQIDNILYIDTLPFDFTCFFCYSNPPRIEITLPYFEVLNLSSASQAYVTGLDNQTFTLDASGASNITLSGITSKFDATLSGASKLNSLELVASDVSIDASGASSINLNAQEKLDIKLSGASKLFYLGSPQITQNVSGASKIEAIDPDQYYLDYNTGKKITPTLSPAPVIYSY